MLRFRTLVAATLSAQTRDEAIHVIDTTSTCHNNNSNNNTKHSRNNTYTLHHSCC